MYRGWAPYFRLFVFLSLTCALSSNPLYTSVASPVSNLFPTIETSKMQTIKCVVVGDGAVGKVRWMLLPLSLTRS